MTRSGSSPDTAIGVVEDRCRLLTHNDALFDMRVSALKLPIPDDGEWDHIAIARNSQRYRVWTPTELVQRLPKQRYRPAGTPAERLHVRGRSGISPHERQQNQC